MTIPFGAGCLLIPMQITNAFSNEPSDRQFQDVGFDGLVDDEERTKFSTYLEQPAGNSAGAYQQALSDPSADNFKPYRDAVYDAAGAGILRRYKNINNPHGNSPIANTNSELCKCIYTISRCRRAEPG